LLQLDGHYEQAEKVLLHALRMFPNNENTKYLLSLFYLRCGDYLKGFELFEHRFVVYTENKIFTGLSRWKGETTDKTVIIWREQGNGDTLMMIRYWPEIERRAPNAVLMVEKELIPLLRFNGVSHLTVAAGGDPDQTLQCPLLSIPHVFGVTAKTVNGKPYLKAPPSDFTKRAAANNHKIGFCWSGNPNFENDVMRSLPGPIRDQIGELGDFLSLAPQHTGARSWADTAAIVAQLPLVISVDTAIAHLAGALGVPTWLLLPYNNDWRWGASSSRTCWYNSMWVFRCPKHGDWASVVDDVACSLKGRSNDHNK
jgi:hypothetical protein